MATVAAPPDDDGWCSLSLHAGGTLEGARARRAPTPSALLIVEVSPKFPRTRGLPPEHRHAIHVDEIDLLVESDGGAVRAARARARGETDEAIAAHARRFIPDGADAADRDRRRSRRRSSAASPRATAATTASTREMFTDGLMRLHEAGKVTNRKGQFDGVSVATFAGGSAELYRWLDGNDEVAFLPVEVVNSPELIGRNRTMVTINGALAVDIHGQVVADTIARRPVLRHRRPRGLRRRPGAVARGPLAALPALDRDDRRRAALADRPLVRGRRP